MQHTRISTTPWIPNVGKKNSKEDHINCFRKNWLHPPPFIQYSHNAYATSLSLRYNFSLWCEGWSQFRRELKNRGPFLIFLPVPWALGSLLEIGGESQQAGDHPTHPHHSSTLEPAWKNIPVNILPTMNGGSVKHIFRFKLLNLKGLSHEIDFENVDENLQILALTRAAAGFWIFQRHLWFLVQAFLTEVVSFNKQPIRGSVGFAWANRSKALTNIRAPGELQLSVGLLFAHQ